MSNGPDELDETLWRHDIKMGWLRKKSYILTLSRRSGLYLALKS